VNALNPHDLTNITLSVLHDLGGYHAGFDGPDRFPGFFAFGNGDEHRRAIAHRLVACWNACLGMADPALEVARLRAGELSAHLGDGVAALLPDHPDASHPGPWHVVDCSGDPSMVMTVDGRWALYPDSEAQEFTDLDQACDIALGFDGDVVPVVRVG